jgi:DNA-binding NtrC family response regulator
VKKQDAKILIIDDDEDILLAFRLLVQKQVSLVRAETDPRLLPDLLQKEIFDIIFLDMNFEKDVTSGQEGITWLKKILTIDPSAIVILITAYGDVEMAVRAVREGAVDFILKPWQNEKLLATLSATLALSRSRIEAKRLREQQKQLSADIDQPFLEIIGQGVAMKRIYETIIKVAKTEANILILGENGTGKELVARAIHRQSERREKVFISVDMGAISETLFESELFGHVRGAFTDARKDHPGRFEIAEGGTLFLDEIANLPPALQAKLLSVLETRQITRVGSNKRQSVDIRLICATNRPVMQMVDEGTFRQDLLYRINTVEIILPPLRERREDIPLLAEHFRSLYARKYKKTISSWSEDTIKRLQSYHWPGNIRELQHAIERAIILSDSDILQKDDFQFPGLKATTADMPLDDYKLEEMEKLIIHKALKNSKGNISEAARLLGLSRAALYRRMERYEL